MSSSSHCVHSFYFLQDALIPDFIRSAIKDSTELNMANMTDRILQYATNNPIKFVALSTFTVLGGLPVAGFMAYAVATIIASLIGALVLELVLLGVGITGLAFVLFFVTCITMCTTSVFVSLYYSYQIANRTWSNRSWLARPTQFRTDPSLYTETTNTDQVDESFDKTKSNLAIGYIRDTFARNTQYFSTAQSHDFLKTALVTLFLSFSIFVMTIFVVFIGCLVVQFT